MKPARFGTVPIFAGTAAKPWSTRMGLSPSRRGKPLGHKKSRQAPRFKLESYAALAAIGGIGQDSAAAIARSNAPSCNVTLPSKAMQAVTVPMMSRFRLGLDMTSSAKAASNLSSAQSGSGSSAGRPGRHSAPA